MAKTNAGLNYPLATDPLADGAATIQNLARCMQRGKVTVPVASGQVSGSLAVVFPEAFYAAPTVVLTTQDSIFWPASAFTVTTTGFTAWVRNIDNNPAGSAQSLGVCWFAIGPMTAT